MLVSALKDADPAKPASVVLQTVGNATIKRDYGALTKFLAAVSPLDCAGRRELAKLTLCHDTIEASLKFKHLVIAGPQAVVAANDGGDEESEDDDDDTDEAGDGKRARPDRKSGVEGKRVDLGGRRTIKKKTLNHLNSVNCKAMKHLPAHFPTCLS